MLTPSDKKKLGKAQASTLEALKAAGDRGLDTLEIMKHGGTRAVARVCELRKLGHLIEVTRVPGDRLLFNYRWRGYDESGQLTLFKVA